MKEGRREEADAAKAEVAKLKESQKEVADALAATEVEIREILLTIPNVPCAIVLTGAYGRRQCCGEDRRTYAKIVCGCDATLGSRQEVQFDRL